MPSGVRLIKECPDKDIYVNIDKNLFVKAVYYLILASADKSPKDDFVLLQMAEHGNKPDEIEISIKFQGEPLTDEEKEKLLSAVFDIDAFGIELNVPISQKIIEEQNGTLTISSSNKGNALIITLPAVERSDIPAEKDKIL
jgi:signal transduction histidine kinase